MAMAQLERNDIVNQEHLLNFVIDTIARYGINWSTEGEICAQVGEDEFRAMRYSHFQCILRRDYIEKYGNKKGLSKEIKRILDFSRETAKKAKPNGQVANIEGFV